MASTFTTNLHVELQGTGDNSGTWGTTLNSAALTIIDQCLGDVQTVSLSSSNVSLSTAQSQHNYFKLTGTLTANVTVTWPAIGRTVYVFNSTTGAFSVTLASAGGGTSVVIPQGNGIFIIMDGTNVVADPIPFGTLQAIAGGTTIDLGAAPARNVSVTTSGWTCTSFGSSASTTQPLYLINFVATGTLTYNATSMILPGGISISVDAGDSCFAVYLGSGNWRVISYTVAAAPMIGYRFVGVQTFTASSTYTPTTGVRYVKVTVIAGGGAGGGSNSGSPANNAGGGGGQGGTAIYYGAASVQTVTVGTGGAGSAGSSGAAGTASSFGALAVAAGGSGGSAGSSSGIFTASSGGAGGTVSAGTIKLPGQAGGGGGGWGASGDDAAMGGVGGGQGGGKGATVTETGAGAGSAGSGYGSGGGGACRADSGSNAAGGAGAGGIVIVEEFA